MPSKLPKRKWNYPDDIDVLDELDIPILKKLYRYLPGAKTEHEQKVIQKITDILVSEGELI